jgi:5-methylcytosine-specific restriction endonuclease McrA
MVTKQELIDAIENSNSIKQAINKLFGEGSRSYKLFNKLVVLHEQETIRKSLRKRSFSNVSRRQYTDAELFTKSKSRRNCIRNRIIKNNLIPYECANVICPTHLYSGLWCGEKLTLDLDHIDGDNRNNNLTNLRFLCKNCHSQTPTYGSRNTAEQFKPNDLKKFCLICGKEIKDRGYKYCKLCKSDRVVKGGEL